MCFLGRICDFSFSGYLEQSATGKMTVVTVWSFQFFHEQLRLICKLHVNRSFLCKTYFLNFLYKWLIALWVTNMHRLLFSQNIPEKVTTIHDSRHDTRSRFKDATMARARWHEHDSKVTIHDHDSSKTQINIPIRDCYPIPPHPYSIVHNTGNHRGNYI